MPWSAILNRRSAGLLGRSLFILTLGSTLPMVCQQQSPSSLPSVGTNPASAPPAPAPLNGAQSSNPLPAGTGAALGQPQSNATLSSAAASTTTAPAERSNIPLRQSALDFAGLFRKANVPPI